MGLDSLMVILTRLKAYLPDSKQRALANYFKTKRRITSKPHRVVLVQCVEDLYCFGIFGQIISSLRAEKDIRVDQYVLRSLRLGEANSLLSFILSRIFFNPLHTLKWTFLYQSFCDRIAYKSTSFHPISDGFLFFQAWKSWRRLKIKNNLITMIFDNIMVGDLINDSYLRFKPAPTVCLNDYYLLIIIWQAYRDIRRAQWYFSRTKPCIYLTSYSTYIQHGIAVRVALAYGVKVFSFGNYQEFAKELSCDDWVHTKNTDHYAKFFNTLEKQDEKIQAAEKALGLRLAGGVDAATAYMKKSAYLTSQSTIPDVSNAVVVFLHDFYDSPHVYRNILFPDFWEWVCFTVNVLQQSSIPFFLKPHPNQVDLSDAVLLKLQTCYPNLAILPSGVSNKQLVDEGMCCAVTVYGSIGHEMAYFGIPTIACAHHPHISFNFCKTATSLGEYSQLLKNANKINVDENIKQESLAFYYMHNLNLQGSSRDLNELNMLFRNFCEKNPAQDFCLSETLDKMRKLAAYCCYIEKLAAISNKMRL